MTMILPKLVVLPVLMTKNLLRNLVVLPVLMTVLMTKNLPSFLPPLF